MSYIYKTTCTITNKIYIGQCNKKVESTKSYFGSGTVILQAIKKYGKENFIKEILKDNLQNQKELDIWEQIFIKKFNSTNRDIGYNILPGTSNGFGCGSPMLIKDIRDKVVAKLKIIINTTEFKDKAKKSRDKWWSENEYKKKEFSKLGKKLIGENNPNFGKNWTEEQKQEQRDKMVGRFSGDKNANFGNKWNDKQKKLQAKKQREHQKINGNPMTGKVRINNGIINSIMSKNEDLPDGWYFGMLKRKK